MKNIRKDNKGITLVILVLTIVILIILSSVTIYTGVDTYKNAKVVKFVEQMKFIQSKVDELVNKSPKEELINMGEAITTDEQKNALSSAYKNQEISNNDIAKYRYFSKEKILEVFDTENIDDEIMINFETREVVSLYGIKYEEKIYYTQYKLPNGQNIINNNNQAERALNFKLELSIDGLNSVVTISNISISNGTLMYQKDGSDYWTSITNYTEKEKDETINISETGIYKFKLIDNVSRNQSPEQNLNIVLTNKPRAENNMTFITNAEGKFVYNYAGNSENWAYAKDNTNGSYYVWVPRFASDVNSNIKFIKGTSNNFTDNKYIDNSKWTISNDFVATDGTALTGKWVNVSQPNQPGLNLINLVKY